VKLVAGLVAVFALFQAVAIGFHSARGEAGVLVALAVVTALVGIEAFLFKRGFTQTLAFLGLGRPALRSLVAAGVIGILLVAVLLTVTRTTGIALPLISSWPVLVVGIIAQAGIAEETLFRAYLFGHLRAARPFWQAAFLAMLPFLVVHLFLFFTLPPAVAAAAVGLAAISSFPLAYLFELGRGTIWASALVHSVMQGALKLVAVPSEATLGLPLLWIAASALTPFLVFLVGRPRDGQQTEA
jgi:membrane protease YdiL (CAAX protease family)